MRILDAEATQAALPFDRLVPALRQAFAAGAVVPMRHHHAVAQADGGPDATLLLMPAWQERFLGIKLVTVHPANPARGLPAVHALYLLSHTGTGQPVALLDGGVLTARRTAAASALAADFLARADAARLLLVGAGRVASLVAPAMRVVRPGIGQVSVWNPTPARAEALVASLRRQGFAAERVDDLQRAVTEADIVSCATLATDSLVRGAWLRAGAHLDLVGAFTPAMREADEQAVARAAVYADTDAALHECGELAGLAPSALRGTLEALCRGTAPGRQDAAELTLFKSVGTALEDLAAASLAVEGSVG